MPLYFESRATGPILMTEAVAHALLRALGRSQTDGTIADEGIFTPEQLPALIAALESLIEASKQKAQAEQQSTRADDQDGSNQEAGAIGMHQRAWPLLDQCRRALAAEKPVTWRKT